MRISVKIKKNIVPLLILKRKLREISRQKVDIGFFSDSQYGPENGSLPVAQVAWWQEKGTEQRGQMHIPSRPFMTTTINAIRRGKSPKLKQALLSSVAHVLFRQAPYAALGKAGDAVKDEMVRQIETWSMPANSPYTISKKGRNDPLIDTGFMQQCVAFRVRRK